MSDNDHRRRRSDHWALELFGIAGLVGIVGAAVFKDYLLFHKLYIFKDIGSDTVNQCWPFYVHISEYLRADGIPKWSFSQGMGQNIFPGGLNNPFDMILFILGNPKLLYGIGYVEYFKVVLGGTIFYYYAKSIPLTRFAAMVGGLVFAFSGYMIVGSGWYSHSTAVVYGAFLLFSFEKLFKGESPAYFPIAIALIGSYSAFFLYTFGFFIICYALFRFFDEYGFQWQALARLLVRIAALGFLGVLIGAVFIGPDVSRMIQSPRVGGDFGYFQDLRSLPVYHFGDKMHYVTAVMRLFSNDILGTGSHFRGWGNYLEAPAFYCGTITLLLIPQVFGSLNKQRKIVFSVFASFWVMIIVFPFLRHAIYLFSGDYYRGGISFFVPAVMLFLGLRALSGIDKSMRLSAPLLIATALFLILLLYFPYFTGRDNPVVGEIRIISTAAIICFSVLICLLKFDRYRRFSKAMILLLLCIEVGSFSNFTANKRPVVTPDELHKRIGYNDYTIEAVEYIKRNDNGFYRINKNYSSSPAASDNFGYNDAQVQGYYGTPSYHSFNQKKYIDFLVGTDVIQRGYEHGTRWSKGLIERPFLLTLTSVKYTLSKGDASFYTMYGYERTRRFGDVEVLKNLYFLPLGFTYDRFMPYDEFKVLDSFQKDIVLLNAFVVDGQGGKLTTGMASLDRTDIKNLIYVGSYPRVIRERRADALEISQHGQNYIRGNISLGKRKLLFLSIPYDKGWSVIVDGRKQPLHLVNLGFMGVSLEKGDHAVELIYSPPYVAMEAIVSVSAFFSYMLMIVARIGRKSNGVEI